MKQMIRQSHSVRPCLILARHRLKSIKSFAFNDLLNDNLMISNR